MKYLDVMFADVGTALDRDVKLVTRFNDIQFHDKRAALTIAATP